MRTPAMLLVHGVGAKHENIEHLETVDGLSGFEDFTIGLKESRKNKAQKDV